MEKEQIEKIGADMQKGKEDKEGDEGKEKTEQADAGQPDQKRKRYQRSKTRNIPEEKKKELQLINNEDELFDLPLPKVTQKDKIPEEQKKQEEAAVARTDELAASLDQLVGLTELLVKEVKKEKEKDMIKNVEGNAI